MMKNTQTIQPKSAWTNTSQDQQLIAAYYDKLTSSLPSDTPPKDWKNLEKAFQLALASHAGARRKSGEPYIIHPLRVAYIVAKEIGLGPASIISAILHDVVEDTRVSINEVRQNFGDPISTIVRGLTKMKKIMAWHKSMQAENFKKLFLSTSEDNRIILVKLADRLDNMRYLGALPRQKQLKIAAETQQIYAPVAHRLGLNRIKGELEDLYLQYMHPTTYQALAQKLEAATKERIARLNVVFDTIQEAIQQRGIAFHMDYRVKSLYSIWRKVVHSKIPFEQIYDMIALRIIIQCDPSEEKALCWQVYGIISHMYTCHTNRLRDWISKPKFNGYECLHGTIMGPSGEWIEVQIRTKRMHQVAERGVAAHWAYKQDMPLGEGAKRLEKWLKEIRTLLEEDRGDSVDLIEDFKLSLYDDEIMAFDKNGTRLVLPKGATVLDFAIEMLDEKGFKCSGAIVNDRFLPINYELENAEQVELMLNPHQEIPPYWVDIPRTAKARRLLKSFFRKQYLSTLQQGKKILNAVLKKAGHSFNKKVEALLPGLLEERNLQKVYHKIGSNAISKEKLAMVVKALPNMMARKADSVQEVPVKWAVKEDVVVHGSEDPQCQLAPCCLPIPDEEIFGVLTMEGMQIHRVDCPKAAKILSTQGHRIAKARWAKGKEDSFLVLLAVKATDWKGMTKEIMDAIKRDVHIESVSFLEQEGYIQGRLSIGVEHATKLFKVMKNLEQVKGIVSVDRVSV